MAITYHSGRRIQALSTDLESTTVTTTQLVWNTSTLTGYTASNSDRTLTKTTSNAWNNSSAKSTASFTVGNKFSIEMSRDNLTASTMLGFSTSSSPSAGYAAAQFSMYMAGSYFQVYENGGSVYNDESTGGTVNASDRYKIEVDTDGTVKYYLDDGGTGTWVEQYESANTASGTYYINSSSYAQNSTATLGNSIVTVVNDLKPTNVQAGSRLEETDTRKMYHYVKWGDNWYLEGSTIPPQPPTRGVIAGGSGDVIDYITIATTGNATDFGDLTSSRPNITAVSASTRGVFAGGSSDGDTMDYITFATTGNATDFGNLTQSRYNLAGLYSSTRGVFAGGWTSSAVNTMDYITMDTLGNATDFGDMYSTQENVQGASSLTRGVIAGGYGSSNVMQYITIATTGNSIDFGDLTVGRYGTAGTSDKTRGVYQGGHSGGGSSGLNVIDYITIATTGNATDFGDLTVARRIMPAVSNNTRGCACGGNNGGSVNTIDYITIATTGNSTDFGDLTVARSGAGGANGL